MPSDIKPRKVVDVLRRLYTISGTVLNQDYISKINSMSQDELHKLQQAIKVIDKYITYGDLSEEARVELLRQQIENKFIGRSSEY